MSRLTLIIAGSIVGFSLLGACSNMPDAKANSAAIPTHIKPCADSPPRCVSTESQTPDRHMAPLQFRDSRKVAQERLREIVKRIPRATITQDVPGYLAVEVKSELMGFTDDVEFLFDAKENIVRFRSSSRVGYYDFGVNRKRMEAITSEFQVVSAK